MAKRPVYTHLDLVPKATPRGLELAPVVAKALLSHASEDFTRPHLCGVGLDVNGSRDSAWLVATDGHRLIRMPITGTIPDGIGRIVWPEKEVNAALARMIDVFSHGEEGAPLLVLPWIKSDHECLPVQQVIPPDGLGSEIAWFNPQFLADACKVGHDFAKATKTETMLSIAAVSLGRSALDPMRYVIAFGEATLAEIVVMPMRGPTEAKLPKTHGGAGATVAPKRKGKRSKVAGNVCYPEAMKVADEMNRDAEAA